MASRSVHLRRSIPAAYATVAAPVVVAPSAIRAQLFTRPGYGECRFLRDPHYFGDDPLTPYSDRGGAAPGIYADLRADMH